MTRLLIFGAGGHGAVVAEAASASGSWKQIAFVDDRYPQLRECLGYPVIGDRSLFARHMDENDQVVVALGENRAREMLADLVRSSKFELATVIHPFSCVSASAQLGKGTMVLPGAVINARAQIGLGVIVNTGATIDHDCIVGDYAHIAPGAHLAAAVHVGDRAWLGIGAAVREGTRIGKGAVVGAGAAVIANVAELATVGGVPARLFTKS